MEPSVAPVPPARAARLLSLDAYRGFVMFLMAAELLQVPEVAEHFSGNPVWQWLGRHSGHVGWTGCTLHDLIQPSFSFMVGVALPFSLAGRLSAGATPGKLWLHACWRGLVLVLLGVFLRSIGREQTYWTFEDTLSQIGLGYPLLFALGFARWRTVWITLGLLLAGYWALFALWPLPGAGFDYSLYRVPAGWPHHFSGFSAHWNINSNPAWAFDRWFLNAFPREQEFMGNPGGYATLSFIPTLGTMVLGLCAGRWIQQNQANPGPRQGWLLTGRLALAGLTALAAGYSLDRSGLCPSVKKIWTPSWVLFSGGWCFLLMGAFYLMADVLGWRRLFFPLVVIGTNSIAMYVLVHTTVDFFHSALSTHFGTAPFHLSGEALAPLCQGATVLLLLWLILWWMYRRRLFLKV